VLTVHVQGFQFEWAVQYYLADLGIDRPQCRPHCVCRRDWHRGQGSTLHVPVGEKVPVPARFKRRESTRFMFETSSTSWTCAGGQLVYVTANTTGRFHGQCAELCGLNHALMRFNIKVETREEFDQYIAARKSSMTSPRRSRQLRK